MMALIVRRRSIVCLVRKKGAAPPGVMGVKEGQTPDERD
jgi:hypothetical protein